MNPELENRTKPAFWIDVARQILKKESTLSSEFSLASESQAPMAWFFELLRLNLEEGVATLAHFLEQNSLIILQNLSAETTT